MLSKKDEILSRLKQSQSQEATDIFKAVDTIKNITTGMDIFQIELDRLAQAPPEWNFYSPLKEDKMSELVESIIENGLLNPIIVWERGNDEYMILAGHNRVNAYRRIFQHTKDPRYMKIFAYVKKTDELSDDEARAIIIDTNFVQRELSTAEKTKSIVIKYRQLGRKTRNSRGKNTASVIAEQYNISERQVYNYYKLNDLIQGFIQRIDEGSLSIKAGVKLASFSKEFQKRLYEDYNDFLGNRKILRIDAYKSEEEIINQIQDIERSLAKITVKVPKDREDELISYIRQWFEQNNLSIN